jgi:spore germination protein GerM
MRRQTFLLVGVVLVFAIIGAAFGVMLLGDRAAAPGEDPGENTLPGGDPPAAGDDNGDTAEPGNGAADGPGNGAPQNRTVQILLYFSDPALVESNEPGETGYLKAVTRQFPHTLGVLRLALEELIKGPQPGEGDLNPTLPATTRILGLRIEGGVALIDFSPEVLTDPGSPQGSFAGGLFIQSLVYTATQFPTVDKVLVTVGGEVWSDGHFVWDEPIGR